MRTRRRADTAAARLSVTLALHAVRISLKINATMTHDSEKFRVLASAREKEDERNNKKKERKKRKGVTPCSEINFHRARAKRERETFPIITEI